MKRLLHIVKDPNDKKPLEVIRSQAGKEGQTEIRVVLIQDAVKLHLDFPASVYVLTEDLEERGMASPYPKIDYPRFLDLIFSSESVVNW